MDAQLSTIYFKKLEKIFKVYDIFKDYFREDFVDLQGVSSLEEFQDKVKDFRKNTSMIPNDAHCNDFLVNNPFILVYFPSLYIENEYDKRHLINKLYAKVPLTLSGKLYYKFYLNRAEYSIEEYLSHYMHSHINYIPKDDFTEFQEPCTGSGPINNTIGSLNVEFDEDLWSLFCVELDKYVRVESIAGIPYRRLENVGNGIISWKIKYPTLNLSHSWIYTEKYPMRDVKEFIRYIINSNCLNFSFFNGTYNIGMPVKELVLTISNLFIEFHNKRLKEGHTNISYETLVDKGTVYKGAVINNIIHANPYGNDNINYDIILGNIGKEVCVFKGNTISLNITGIAEKQNEFEYITVLNIHLIEYILYKILRIINCRYGRQKTGSTQPKIRYV